MEFGPENTVGTHTGIPGFANFVVPRPVNDTLYEECRDNVEGWARHTLRKMAIRGDGGWVDPKWGERLFYYSLKKRHLYMGALAHLEEAIPKQVLRAMDEQGYPSVWDGQYRDLCSLIVVVQRFMDDAVK
jgi:hypothetical protein